jgi:hypothetical protein
MSTDEIRQSVAYRTGIVYSTEEIESAIGRLIEAGRVKVAQ